MTITYHIDPDNEFIDVVLSGQISVVALIRLARDIMDEPTFDPLFDVLADCSAARIGRVTFDLAEAMVAINSGNEARRIAIVMPRGDGARHATRFVELRRDRRRARTFATRSLAEAWLATPPPEDD